MHLICTPPTPLGAGVSMALLSQPGRPHLVIHGKSGGGFPDGPYTGDLGLLGEQS